MAKIFPMAPRPERLVALRDEALAALKRLNVALAHAAPFDRAALDMPEGYFLSPIETERAAIPQPTGPRVAPRRAAPTSREELISVARKLGMSEARIAERFGTEVVAATGNAGRPSLFVAPGQTAPMTLAAKPQALAKPKTPAKPSLFVAPGGAKDSSGIPF